MSCQEIVVVNCPGWYKATPTICGMAETDLTGKVSRCFGGPGKHHMCFTSVTGNNDFRPIFTIKFGIFRLSGYPDSCFPVLTKVFRTLHIHMLVLNKADPKHSRLIDGSTGCTAAMHRHCCLLCLQGGWIAQR